MPQMPAWAEPSYVAQSSIVGASETLSSDAVKDSVPPSGRVTLLIVIFGGSFFSLMVPVPDGVRIVPPTAPDRFIVNASPRPNFWSSWVCENLATSAFVYGAQVIVPFFGL